MKKVLAIVLLGVMLLTGIMALPVQAGYFTTEGHTCYMYLGPWVWNTDPNVGHTGWYPAPNAIGALDMRSIPEMSQKGGTPGWGFFFCTAPLANGAGYIYLGTDFNISLPQNIIVAANNKWKISLNSYTTNGTIWELFTQWGDDTGNTRWRPLIPEQDGTIQILINGFSPVVFAKDKPRCDNIFPNFRQPPFFGKDWKFDPFFHRWYKLSPFNKRIWM